MAYLGFFLGILTSVMFYWLFIKENCHKKWYTCVLAIVFIAWTLFSVDFVITTVMEGMPQAAMVAAVLLGIVEIVLLVLLIRFSNITLKPGAKTVISGK